MILIVFQKTKPSIRINTPSILIFAQVVRLESAQKTPRSPRGSVLSAKQLHLFVGGLLHRHLRLFSSAPQYPNGVGR